MKTISIKTTLFWIAFILILFMSFVAVKQSRSIDANENVEITFMSSTDDSDCIVMQQGENVILIDTGLKEDAPALVEFLKSKHIQTINYMVLTHPDMDHIGGAEAVLESFKVNEIILPNYNKENQMLYDLSRSIQQKGVHVIYPTRIRNLTIGSMEMTVYPPLESNYLKDNNYSLATMIKHKNVHMLFAGDAQKTRLAELKKIHWPEKIDLYKVNYHGRYADGSEAFIKKIKPAVSVITARSCDDKIRNACKSVQSQVFFAGGTNKIIFVSDGNAVSEKR